MMTEDQARNRWCPFVRITLETEHWKAMNNREQPLTGNGIRTNCIASNCMAWQWERTLVGGNDKDGFEYENGGYCGLARKE